MIDATEKIRSTRGIQQMLITPPRLVGAAMPREAKGVVYTKRWVVDLMLDLAGYRVENDLVHAFAVEPAAGEGAFLGPMIERLLDSCQRLKCAFSECRNSLLAYELDDESATRARSLAAGILAERGVAPTIAEQLADSWVRTGDYLFEATSIAADYVIGNPPYVRLEDIPEETAMQCRSAYPSMRGRADLYVAFFEAALRQLRNEGVCAFICADRWMRNQYGAELRELVTSMYAVDVVMEMHNAGAFHEEVDAYPAITIIRRHKQGQAVVASAGPEIEKIPPASLSRAIQAATCLDENAAPLNGLRVAAVHSWFEGATPWPCHSPQQLALLRRLEERFPTLEAHARVGIGVATGNDRVFITEDTDLVECSRLLKLALAADIAEGRMKWSGHYLVNPWDGGGLVKLENYPRLRSYFEKHEAALRKRHTAAKNVRGWYRTIDRVTQPLTERPKLYIADIKNVLDPVCLTAAKRIRTTICISSTRKNGTSKCSAGC